ncbi:hypothetical protein Scep_022343 [Stephania cephalantha]|uniref:NB-ARC domain-containing protein n=1 Tax=Stephania cephalantha TaxID=152367 RepID=A0AAP0F5Z7_9MAGN
MAHKIKNVVERLDEIAAEKAKFHFREGVMETEHVSDAERRHTSSFVTEPRVYGRDDDKEKIVQLLLANMNSQDDISIYAIFGMGGLGKTTLTQAVYNDERVMEHFELKIWVCVSEEFNIKRLTRAIIESAGGMVGDLSELDPMQCRLRDILNGKRFLLVLDDVWNENQDEWDKLKSALKSGVGTGNSIIVTTRIEKIARMMATLPLHQLELLSKDDSWSLFKRLAFESRETEHHSNLIMIGEDIVKKCGGVPLAIKALGGMLRFKDEEIDWLAIKESEMWDVSEHENGIIPSLRLSYKHLPSHLRQCFAVCSIFPKDYEIQREYVIQLWMANGFIPSNGQMDLEDVGHDIFNNLLWRSFFQEPWKDRFGNIMSFKMHDLMHDLALSIMKNECFTMENGMIQEVPKEVRHLSYNNPHSSQFHVWNRDVDGLRCLRSFHILSSIRPLHFDGISPNALKKSSLRMLHFPVRSIKKWPIFVHRLRHLRFLDLSFSDIKLLPESFTSLQNLQTLNLNNCHQLCKLPSDMRHMIKLRHLDISDCSSLMHMPNKMGQLAQLRVLRMFIVGQHEGQRIDELKNLNKLRGHIEIKDLDNVKSPTNAKKANLEHKAYLDSLSLSWRVNRRDGGRYTSEDEKVLESLKPHTNLASLFLSGYGGIEFPSWLKGMMLPNLVSMVLKKCSKCEHLPSLLGRLPLLQNLTIDGMDRVKILFSENNHSAGDTTHVINANATLFPSVKNLVLSDMPNLEDWVLGVEGRQLMFPCLEYLSISRCPGLKVLLPPFQALISLCIEGFEEAETLPGKLLGSEQNSPLRHLEIKSMPRLKFLSNDFFDNVGSLVTFANH